MTAVVASVLTGASLSGQMASDEAAAVCFRTNTRCLLDDLPQSSADAELSAARSRDISHEAVSPRASWPNERRHAL